MRYTICKVKSVSLAIGAALLTTNAVAAVTIHSKVSVDGSGLMAAAAMTANTTETISGDRARSETHIKFDSRLVQAISRRAAGEQVEIVRLDQDKVYQLDPRKKSYREWSLANLRAQLDQVQSQSVGMPVAFDDSQCQWSAARSESTRIGHDQMAGRDVEQWNIRATQTCTDRRTKRQCDLVLDTNFWLAPVDAANEEQRRFNQRYAQKLGVDGAINRAARERAQAMFARYGGLWRESLSKIAALKGEALRTELALATQGADCGASQSGAGDATASGQRTEGDVGRDIAAISTEAVVTEKTGRWRMGELGGEIVGKLLSRKKKKDAAPTDAAVNKNSDDGLARLVTVSYEITAIETVSVTPDFFDVPASYKPAR
jgi:hypothetical protein